MDTQQAETSNLFHVPIEASTMASPHTSHTNDFQGLAELLQPMPKATPYIPPEQLLQTNNFRFETVPKQRLMDMLPMIIEALPNDIHIAHSYVGRAQPFAILPIGDALSWWWLQPLGDGHQLG
jgi:hypothetical protein